MENYEEKFVGKNVMITGGLGFIGSNLAHRLVNLNPNKIIIVDSLVKKLGGNIQNIEGIRSGVEIPNLDNGGINIGDAREIIPLLEDIDYIFNLAGSVSHIDSKNNPVRDLKLNLEIHVSFLESCRKYFDETGERPKIVFSATRDIYGKVREEDIPVKESLPVREIADPQGIHNHGAEFHHLWYGKTFGIPVSSLRLTNTYGPRQKISDSTMGFLGYFIYQALKNEEIELWGGGESLRDFNHVDDVVEALLMTMTSEKTNGEAYNLGSFIRRNGRYNEIGGNIRSVGEAAHVITYIAKTGRCIEIPYPENKKSIEPGHVYLDATKIHKAIGWEPKIGFEEGIEKTIKFYRENRKFYW